jgi:hypothetical protein
MPFLTELEFQFYLMTTKMPPRWGYCDWLFRRHCSPDPPPAAFRHRGTMRLALFAKSLPMGYHFAMRLQRLFVLSGMIFMFVAAPRLRADLVEMQNGDRYSGKVLSVSADTVVLESGVLGKINVPRKKVATLMIGANAATLNTATNVARVFVSTNLPTAASSAALANTNVDLSAAFRNLGANTNFVGQIRQQMLAGSPEAASNYDELVNGLMSGELNLNDLRREAKSSADQLRQLKRDLGPEAGDSIDAYLGVLDNFLKETAAEPASATLQPKSPTL